MATITATSMQGLGGRVVTRTTMTASDTFTYNPNARAVLLLDNITAGPLTVTIDGNGGTTVPVAGIGNVDVSSGFSTASIAAAATLAIPLDAISAYLQGTITLTGGTGIRATLLEF